MEPLYCYGNGLNHKEWNIKKNTLGFNRYIINIIICRSVKHNITRMWLIYFINRLITPHPIVRLFNSHYFLTIPHPEIHMTPVQLQSTNLMDQTVFISSIIISNWLKENNHKCVQESAFIMAISTHIFPTLPPSMDCNTGKWMFSGMRLNVISFWGPNWMAPLWPTNVFPCHCIKSFI